MLRERINLLRKANVIIDLTVTALSFILAYYVRRDVVGEPLGELGPLHEYLWLLLVILPLWWFLLAVQGAYASQRVTPIPTMLWIILKTVFIGMLALGAVLYLSKQYLLSRLLVGLFLVINGILLFIEKALVKYWLQVFRKRGYNFRTVLVVGENDKLEEVIGTIQQHPEWGMRILGFVALNPSQLIDNVHGVEAVGYLDDIGDLIKTLVVDEVIFAVPLRSFDKLENSIRICEEQGVKTAISTHFYTPTVAKTYVEDYGGIPMLILSTAPQEIEKLFFKRIFDTVVAGVLITLLAPFFLLIALLIRLTSRGPILFRQTRVGLNGRPFTMYKFRTMVENAEALKEQLLPLNEMTFPTFKLEKDPRVTKIGRILRKVSLDELPQLFNVLKGDMSLVGPRPPIVEEVNHYSRNQRRRLSMRPGITCIWQVSGRNDVDFDEWMKLDLEYINNWSLKLDFKLLLKTIPTVLLGRGAK